MMLVDGIHHVATLTADTEGLHACYQSVFEAEIALDREEFPGARLSVVEFAPFLVANPDAVDGLHNKPGTPSARFRG
jgi:hypothetical protein